MFGGGGEAGVGGVGGGGKVSPPPTGYGMCMMQMKCIIYSSVLNPFLPLLHVSEG